MSALIGMSRNKLYLVMDVAGTLDMTWAQLWFDAGKAVNEFEVMGVTWKYNTMEECHSLCRTSFQVA